MSLTNTKEPTVGDRVIVTSWVIMGMGIIPVGLMALAGENLNQENLFDVLFSSLAVIEGVGLTLNGVGVQLNTAPSPSVRDQLNISGRILLGLGLCSIPAIPLLPNRVAPKAVTGLLVTSGAVCLGVAEDTATLVKWT